MARFLQNRMRRKTKIGADNLLARALLSEREVAVLQRARVASERVPLQYDQVATTKKFLAARDRAVARYDTWAAGMTPENFAAATAAKEPVVSSSSILSENEHPGFPSQDSSYTLASTAQRVGADALSVRAQDLAEREVAVLERERALSERVRVSRDQVATFLLVNFTDRTGQEHEVTERVQKLTIVAFPLGGELGHGIVSEGESNISFRFTRGKNKGSFVCEDSNGLTFSLSAGTLEGYMSFTMSFPEIDHLKAVFQSSLAKMGKSTFGAFMKKRDWGMMHMNRFAD